MLCFDLETSLQYKQKGFCSSEDHWGQAEARLQKSSSALLVLATFEARRVRGSWSEAGWQTVEFAKAAHQGVCMVCDLHSYNKARCCGRLRFGMANFHPTNNKQPPFLL